MMMRVGVLSTVIFLAIFLDIRVVIAREGRCQRHCSQRGIPFPMDVCLHRCKSYLRDYISHFGKRSSTTIVGVKAESEGATIDINVKTREAPGYGINKTAWEGLIYLTMLHLDEKRTRQIGDPSRRGNHKQGSDS